MNITIMCISLWQLVVANKNSGLLIFNYLPLHRCLIYPVNSESSGIFRCYFIEEYLDDIS